MQHATLLVGLSNRGHAWAKTLEDHDRFFIKGISEIDQQCLHETGEKFEIPQACRFTDYQMALDSGQFEVVVLVVPSHLHCSMAVLALEAGLHVLVEKPFALRMAEAEEVVQLADRVNKSLTVVQNYRYKENFLELARQIARKPLGQLLAVMGDFRSWRQPKADHELAYPNPMMTIQGVHFLDTLRAILPSPITKVHSVGHRSQLSGWENSSIWHLLMRCENGVPVTFTGSYDSKATFTGYNGLWRFSCEHGDILVNKDGSISHQTEDDQKQVFTSSPDAKSGEYILLDTVHNAITTGTPAPTSGADNLKTLQLLFKIDSPTCFPPNPLS